MRVIGWLNKNKTMGRRQKIGKFFAVEKKWGHITADDGAVHRYACNESNGQIEKIDFQILFCKVDAWAGRGSCGQKLLKKILQ